MRSTPLSNDEFHAAAQMHYGAELTCLKSFTNLPLKSNASATDKTVDAFGSNIKKRAQPLFLLFRSNPH